MPITSQEFVTFHRAIWRVTRLWNNFLSLFARKRPSDGTRSGSGSGNADDSVNSSNSNPEPDAARQKRLEAIRLAIANGTYDSEELLEKALLRMLDRFDSE